MRVYHLSASFCLTFAITIKGFCGIGLSDWSAKTPGNNEINNFSGLRLVLGDGTQIDSLDKWYFYKNHIVGTRAQNKGYFIVDEKRLIILKFENENEWANTIDREHIKPSIWTRWYNSNWMFLDDFTYVLFFPIFGIVPLLVLLTWIVRKSIVKERFNFKKPYTKISVSIAAIIILIISINFSPQSL